MSSLPPPSNTRLVTIVAQVDHGKTTLADSLIESNGIISERMAGDIRFLDSLSEEQRRGITMRASAIGLRHLYKKPKQKKEDDMVIHLIDSPGHVDFSAEVTSSLLLCDGAILVIDVVEGMCARTHMILREAYAHELIPILILNKIDRLCLDLCLTPIEAYIRLRSLIEQVNATAAAMILTKHPNTEKEEWNFDPSKGNVIFASAFYGWGFSVPSLARSLFQSKQIGLKPQVLKQYLFSDCKYNQETNKLTKWKLSNTGDTMPIFAEYALQPIWDIYEGVDSAATEIGLSSGIFADQRTVSYQTSKTKDKKIKISSMGMKQVSNALQIGTTNTPLESSALQSIVNSFSSVSSILRAIMRRYRPLSQSVLDAVCEHCPSPPVASSKIRNHIFSLKSGKHTNFDEIQKAVHNCDTHGPTVAHVCKFLSANTSDVSDPDVSFDQSTILLGLARVLSGTLYTKDVLYNIYGPKYQENESIQRSIRLYVLMGSSFVRVKSVPAGHICAIYNLENLQLKTLTLCDKEGGMPLCGFSNTGLQPLVKVNIEPVIASDTDTLERGLMKLSLADSSVQVTATARGERLLACLGEIHLEQSINDLETIYCNINEKKIPLRISDPIVEFGESTTWFTDEMDYISFFDSKDLPLRQVNIPPYCDEEGLGNAWRGRCRSILSGRSAAISLRVLPLSRLVYDCIQEKSIIKESEDDLIQMGKALNINNDDLTGILNELISRICALDANGNAMMETPGIQKGDNVRGIETDKNGEIYTPKESEESHEMNDAITKYENVKDYIRDGTSTPQTPIDESAMQVWKTQMRGSAVAGFQLAMRSGPLCEEPLYGVLVVLEGIEIALTPKSQESKEYETSKVIVGGMILTTLRSAIRCALLTRPVRIMESHLKLTLHSSLAGLGPLYAVLSKRRGRVLADTMVDGTDLIRITATIPQAESFRLSQELLEKSSGEVTAPELVFSHWSLLEEDPFWIPTSLEEREDYGEIVMNGDLSTGVGNNALRYIRMTRKRKGLLVDSSKIVVAAEKQRTLGMNK